MAAFLGLFGLHGLLPEPMRTQSYPVAYAAIITVVAAVAWACRSTWADLRPSPTPVEAAVAVAVGVLVIVLWVALDPVYPRIAAQGARAAYDPATLAPAWRIPYLAVRLLGLIFVVPLIEELFWRSFVLRWIVDPDFKDVPIGRLTPMAVAGSSLLFASAHTEWLPALLTGLAWAGLLGWSRKLSTCWLSHMAANAALAGYVIATGEWKYL
jgi:CAAX prenyl protease-like protein